MTNTEIKEAMIKKVSVMYDGIVYKCVSAIIYRPINNQIKVIAELKDMKANSVTLALIEKITEVTNDNG
jgi:hypothetical protein